MNKTKTDYILPSLIFIAAFLLRVLYIGGTFDHEDTVILPNLVIYGDNWLWMLFHSYGPITPLISEICTSILLIFGVTITEFWWTVPFSVIGTLTVVAIYLMLKKITDRNNALITTAAIALFSVHVETSRYSYGYECVNLFLAILTVSVFISYLKTNNERTGWLMSLLFSFYIISHPHFIVLLLVLIWTAVIYRREKKTKINLVKILSLPVIAIIYLTCLTIFMVKTRGQIYFMSTIHNYMHYVLRSPIAHYFLKAGSIQSEASTVLIRLLKEEIYLCVLVSTLISIPFGIKDVKHFRKRSIFFVWGAIYLVPYYILKLIGDVGMVKYLSFGAVPMLIYVMLLALDRVKNISKTIWVSFILIIFLCVTCIDVFMISFKETINNGRLVFREVSAEERLTGIYHPDAGFKTLGYYVRQYIPEGAVIFSHVPVEPEEVGNEDAYGYFSHSLIHYYLGRHIKYAMHYKSYQAMRREFDSRIDEIDIVITSADNKKYFDSAPDFEIKSVISGKTLNGKKRDLLYIYSRDELTIPQIQMDVAEYNQKYDKMYSYNG
ncbi:glycosyltransferase family 39 protein [Candidatus Pacearchaeota archaeon]|nr:glycosyltransferase family 39 protein [Candidatus Pacearchaeota archaeon]